MQRSKSSGGRGTAGTSGRDTSVNNGLDTSVHNGRGTGGNSGHDIVLYGFLQVQDTVCRGVVLRDVCAAHTIFRHNPIETKPLEDNIPCVT